jgi:hypothetical protein
MKQIRPSRKSFRDTPIRVGINAIARPGRSCQIILDANEANDKRLVTGCYL